MLKQVKVWHLEMLSPPDQEMDLNRPYDLYCIKEPSPEINRFFYSLVGSDWCWYMRLAWTWREWMNFLDSEAVETWVAYRDGMPVGYFELQRQEEGSVEICYFGLVPASIGKGMGKLLLEDAIQKAWLLGGKRVWLHTCTLDHPAALGNYQSRGFQIFRTEEHQEEIPDYPLEPWPGAEKFDVTR